MIKEKQIKEIENWCIKHKSSSIAITRWTEERFSFLLTIVKMQREALEKVINTRYDPVVTLDIVNKALKWESEDEKSN